MDVASPDLLRGFLGHAGTKEAPCGIDQRSGEKVDIIGNYVGMLAVRRLPKLGQVVLRCVVGMFRVADVERQTENSR